MNFTAALTTASLVLLLNGCAASTPPHYYTLVSAADSAPPAVATATFVIRMHQVTVPEQLNQPQLVTRKGDGEIVIADNALWASPLPEEMRSALSGQLAHSLNTVDVTGLTPPQDKPVVGISVAVQRLDVWPGSHASIAVLWRLSFAAGSAEELLLTCRTQHQQTTQKSYPELVSTQQALIRDVATDIVRSIRMRQCS